MCWSGSDSFSKVLRPFGGLKPGWLGKNAVQRATSNPRAHLTSRASPPFRTALNSNVEWLQSADENQGRIEWGGLLGDTSSGGFSGIPIGIRMTMIDPVWCGLMWPCSTDGEAEPQRGSSLPCLLSWLVGQPSEKFHCPISECPSTRKDSSSILYSPADPKLLGAVALTFHFSRPIPECETTPSPSTASFKVLTLP